MNELFNKIACAITHEFKTCSECKKCGDTFAQARVNILEELREFIEKYEEENK